MADAPNPYEELDKKMARELSHLRAKREKILLLALILGIMASLCFCNFSWSGLNSRFELNGPNALIPLVLAALAVIALVMVAIISMHEKERKLWWQRERQLLDSSNVESPEIRPPQSAAEYIPQLENATINDHPELPIVDLLLQGVRKLQSKQSSERQRSLQRSGRYSQYSDRSVHSDRPSTTSDTPLTHDIVPKDLSQYLLAFHPRDKTSPTHDNIPHQDSVPINPTQPPTQTTTHGIVPTDLSQYLLAFHPRDEAPTTHDKNPKCNVTNYGPSTSRRVSKRMEQKTIDTLPQIEIPSTIPSSDISYGASTSSSTVSGQRKQAPRTLTCSTRSSVIDNEASKSKVSKSMKETPGTESENVTQRGASSRNVTREKDTSRQRRKSLRLAQQQELGQVSGENKPPSGGELPRRRMDETSDSPTKSKKSRSNPK